MSKHFIVIYGVLRVPGGTSIRPPCCRKVPVSRKILHQIAVIIPVVFSSHEEASTKRLLNIRQINVFLTDVNDTFIKETSNKRLLNRHHLIVY